MMVGDKTRNPGEENAESGGEKRGIRGRKTRNPGMIFRGGSPSVLT